MTLWTGPLPERAGAAGRPSAAMVRYMACALEPLYAAFREDDDWPEITCPAPLLLYDVARALGLPDAMVEALLGNFGMLAVEEHCLEVSAALEVEDPMPDGDDQTGASER